MKKFLPYIFGVWAVVVTFYAFQGEITKSGVALRVPASADGVSYHKNFVKGRPLDGVENVSKFIDTTGSELVVCYVISGGISCVALNR